ncbi:hypothetical protein GGI18_000868 [Coemansia linderi]|uniref:Uncharacterized protein n=1 Tax=Coemansia linderi TaxID=2663919 RepID=A0ACC1KLR0_9FUNG|nr:hypothetical protein GGI18_000868 [Coemansia linderi]
MLADMALSPSPPPPSAPIAQPPQLPHSPPDTSSTPTSTTQPAEPLPLPLPADAQRWSVDDVCRWAQSQPLLAPVASTLRQHAVDGHVLLNYVTNTILGEELGIAAFGTRVHILEAIELLRWSLGREKPRPSEKRSLSPASGAQPSRSGSGSRSGSRSHSRSVSPASERAASSTSPGPTHGGKRSASRVADAEKKRIKRAEMKKNPALYAEYLQKERERNARRRERLRAERGRSNSGGTAAELRPEYAKPYYTGIR